jgi:hypothetical protein
VWNYYLIFSAARQLVNGKSNNLTVTDKIEGWQLPDPEKIIRPPHNQAG